MSTTMCLIAGSRSAPAARSVRGRSAGPGLSPRRSMPLRSSRSHIGLRSSPAASLGRIMSSKSRPEASTRGTNGALFHGLTWLKKTVERRSSPPGGRPPVPPDVSPARPDRKNRDPIRPGRTDEGPRGARTRMSGGAGLIVIAKTATVSGPPLWTDAALLTLRHDVSAEQWAEVDRRVARGGQDVVAVALVQVEVPAGGGQRGGHARDRPGLVHDP